MTETQVQPPETPDDKVTPLKSANPEEVMGARVAALEEDLARMKDQWVRAAAEAENVRKRAERDRQEMSKYAVSGFAHDMVSVLENLKRASESVGPEARAESGLLSILGDGVDLTLKELLAIFEKYGIRRIDPIGEKFDHNFHQAVAQVEHPTATPGTVAQVVQAGYVMHDRLLRPAMVAVAKAPGGAEAPKQVDTTA